MNCCACICACTWLRERDELSVPDRRRVRVGDGGRKEGGGGITKLHLKLGLSPLESPCTLSLAFLGGFGAQARFFNRNEKETAASRR